MKPEEIETKILDCFRAHPLEQPVAVIPGGKVIALRGLSFDPAKLPKGIEVHTLPEPPRK